MQSLPGLSVRYVAVNQSCAHLLQGLQHFVTSHQDFGCQRQDAALQLLRTKQNRPTLT